MDLARPLRKISARLIRKLGTPATLQRVVTTVDPVKREPISVPTDTYPGHCIVGRYSDRLVDGVSVLRSDRQLTFAAASIGAAPKPAKQEGGATVTWKVVVAGETFDVHDAEPVYAQDQVVLWTIQGRK